MKKKISCLIFLMILFFIFSNGIKAYICEIDGYDVYYNTDTKEIQFAQKNKEYLPEIENYKSDFKPDSKNGDLLCPKKGEYEIYIGKIDIYQTLYVKKKASFSCKVGEGDFAYTIEYNDSGEIVGAKDKDGKYVKYELSSYFTPKNSSQCPTNAEVIFTDNFSTLFVTTKNNDTGANANYINNKTDCLKNNYVWNEKDGYCNTDNLQYVMCGDAHDIPVQIPALISMAVNLLKIATPIVLIIVSIITLVKATMASKEDEIKKAQQSLVRKVIAAVMVFMIISIVQFVVLKVADDEDQKSISSCMSCFLNNNCRGVKYFKTNVNGQYFCTKINNPSEPVECESFYESTPNYNKIPDVVIPQNTN